MRTLASKGCFTVCQRTVHASKTAFSTRRSEEKENPMRDDPIVRAGHNARLPNVKPQLAINLDV